jgi:glycerophosphoryl diester phosphodiesterase
LPPEIIIQAHIPTLEQVFRELKQQKRRMQVKIELKGPNTVEPTLELVDRLDMVDQCSFSSFDISQLELLRKIKPETNEKGDCIYRTGWLFQEAPEDDFLPRALAVGVSEIHLRYDLCTPTIIQQIHEAGLGSMAWMRGPAGMAEDIETKYWDVGPDESSPLLYATLLQSGVQQLCVNKPEVLIAMFGPRSMKKR